MRGSVRSPENLYRSRQLNEVLHELEAAGRVRLSINRQGTAVKLVGAQPSLPRTATTTRDRVAKLFRSPLGSGACGNITTGWGAGVVDVLTYLLFAVVMVVCIWFIDRTLKDDGD